MNRDLTLLRFILLAAENIKLHAACNATDFTKERAISYEFITLGEAVKDISLAIKTAYPNVPWQLISGTRNRLDHDYEDVSSKIIWDIVTNHLPELASQVQIIVQRVEQS